uniref:Uncharacterized protein n=1 Tax=Sphaerodactylus townsendi TaxID=933632 RepID=A0ACB8FK78_9SAUR
MAEIVKANDMSHEKDMFDLRVEEMKLRAELPNPPHCCGNFPQQDEKKWKQFPGLPIPWQMKLEGNLFPNADGKPPQNGNTLAEDAVGSDNANPARNPGLSSAKQTQSCRWTSVHADWCQEDQRQDEFLKELKESQLELCFDPKAIKMVPVQLRPGSPEVEARVSCQRPLRTSLQQCS